MATGRFQDTAAWGPVWVSKRDSKARRSGLVYRVIAAKPVLSMQPVVMHNSFAVSGPVDMCLLVFAHRADPRYPLVLAANRDEFHARPPRGLRVLAGIPGPARRARPGPRGTWMGLTRDGRFAAITNFRDPARTAPAPARGELPLNYLAGGQPPQAFLGTCSSTPMTTRASTCWWAPWTRCGI